MINKPTIVAIISTIIRFTLASAETRIVSNNAHITKSAIATKNQQSLASLMNNFKRRSKPKKSKKSNT